MNIYQNTIKKAFQIEGIGLHTGELVRMRVLPAPPNTGIRFLRIDVKPQIIIPARLDFVVDTSLSTVIGINNIRIHTIEHLMAAFYGMNVDNAIVELSGSEVPICDGSSGCFVKSISDVGLKSQNVLRNYIEISHEFSISQDNKKISIEPCEELEIFCEVSYNHPLLRYQKLRFSITNGDFFKIHNARTFGFLSDVERLRKMGLIRGGTMENAIVLDEIGILNPEGLRYEDEFVRHKTLDIIGDFYLLGYPILGRINTFRSGHQFHYEFAKKFYSNNNLWKLTTIKIPYDNYGMHLKASTITG